MIHEKKQAELVALGVVCVEMEQDDFIGYLEELEKEFPVQEGGATAVTYLDHAGSTLPSRKQLDAMFMELSSPSSPFSTPANPHSMNSALSDHLDRRIDDTRRRVLYHFGLMEREEEEGNAEVNGQHSDYFVIFTSGATASIKLVCDMFPWNTSDGCESTFCYTENVHTSVLGLREFAPNAYVIPSSNFPLSRQAYLSNKGKNCSTDNHLSLENSDCIEKLSTPLNLFAYPGECNFNGSKIDICAIGSFLQSLNVGKSTLDDPKYGASRIKQHSRQHSRRGNWLSLLDASKLASTSSIDFSSLSDHLRPDFICCSFYKMFGYPTGIGALLMKKKLIPLMQKRFFGGGTIAAAAVETTLLRPEMSNDFPHVAFEDGTLNFHGILALKHGFDALDRFGMKKIEKYTSYLAEYAILKMNELKHSNRAPMCQIYSPTSFGVDNVTGSIVAFNMLAYNGDVVGFNCIGNKCAKAKFQVRTGCFCNVGSCQRYFDIDATDILHNMDQGRHCHSVEADVIDGKPTGAVRISVGYMTRKGEIDLFVGFLKREFCDFGFEINPVGTSLPRKSLSEADYFNKCNDYISEEYIIRNICIYPIKSCGGQEVDDWPLGPNGLLYDRTWVLVDQKGQIMTQKQYPQMVKIIPKIDLYSKKISFRAMDDYNNIDVDNCMIASIDLLMADNNRNVDTESGEGDQTVRICGRRKIVSRCDSNQEAQEVNAWFSRTLKVDCQLMISKMNDHKMTNVASNNSFKNDQPFLVVTRESILKLSAICDEEINHMVFRPSMVVERTNPATSEPNSEFIHNWKAMIVHQSDGSDETSKIYLRSQGPCQRCSMINVDPSSGKSDKRLLQTLMAERSILQAATANKVYFGEFFAYHMDDLFLQSDFTRAPRLRGNDKCTVIR